MTKKILVTGATGNIAGIVIPQLVAKGILVNAFVRNKANAEKIKLPGVEIFEGDYSNQDSLNSAAKGTDAVLSITAANSNAVNQASAILKAAELAGTEFILRISAIGAAKDAPTANGRLHFETDTEIMSSGLKYTILRPHFFMQNVFMSVPTIIEQGNIYWAMGDGRLGLVDVRDIADCAVNIIINRGHDGKIYTPTGPESIDFTKIAAIISEKLGKQVNYVNVTFEAVGKAITDMGLDKWFASVMVDYSKAYSQNWGNYTTGDVENITGHKARSFAQFFDEVMSYALKQSTIA